jgi:hypothetical protein
MKTLLDSQLSDATAERVRRSHAEAITEIQDLPATSIRCIPNVELPNAVGVQVPHRTGKKVRCWTSPPRGGGAGGGIFDFGATTPAGRPNDQTQFVCLFATGFGATVVVDVFVMVAT